MQPKFSHTLSVRLSEYLRSSDFDGLTAYLTSISNSAFRTACVMLSNDLPDILERDAFWQLSSHLTLWQPKAFVVTMAKSAARRVKAGTLAFDDEAAQLFYTRLEGPQHVIDRDKLLREWLPICSEPATMEYLFSKLDAGTVQHRIDFLLHTSTLPAAFVLLRTLRYEEYNSELLAATCRALMRKGDSLSFNTASLIRTFFDLTEVGGIFSLNIPAYALSRLDTDYATFCRTIGGNIKTVF